MSYVLLRQPSEQRDRHTETILYDNDGRLELRSCRQENARLTANHQNQGRGPERFPYRFQREHGHADNLILDF